MVSCYYYPKLAVAFFGQFLVASIGLNLDIYHEPEDSDEAVQICAEICSDLERDVVVSLSTIESSAKGMYYT